MNKIELIGRLTREPEVRVSQGESQMTIAKFTLAVDRRRTTPDGQREADFISCTAFGKIGEFAGNYLHQGTKIAVTGRLQTGSYTNKEGQKIWTTDVIVEKAEFVEPKRDGQNQTSQPQAAPAPTGFMNIPDCDDESMPFN